VADGCGDGFGVKAHGGFGFGFDHDASQGLGAGVADDDAAGVFQIVFGGADGGCYGGYGIEGALFADFDVDDDLGKTFKSAVRSSMDLPVRAIRSRTTRAVSSPSPVVARWGMRMWPDCSPPSAASCLSICSRT